MASVLTGVDSSFMPGQSEINGKLFKVTRGDYGPLLNIVVEELKKAKVRILVLCGNLLLNGTYFNEKEDEMKIECWLHNFRKTELNRNGFVPSQLTVLVPS